MSLGGHSAGIYLRSDVKLEPLSCGWYCWGHLIPPLQHALNIAARQLPLLKSFIANPSVHYSSSKDPNMLSAPFVQLNVGEVPRVVELLESTTERCRDLIQLAEEWKLLERQVQELATGFSLEKIYELIPAALSGLVELTYDLRNNPSLRPMEELLARSAFDNSATQEIALSQVDGRKRRFFLNTPRLEAPDTMILPIAFCDARFDMLAKTRLHPASAAELVDELHLPVRLRDRLLQFFTEVPPERKAPNYHGADVRVRYFGHACVLVQSSEVSILIDPVVVCGHAETEAALTFDDLPDVIDYVFLTHNHQDHFCPEIMLQLRSRIKSVLVPRNNSGNIADPSLKIALRRIGFSNVTVMDPLDRVEIPAGEIVSIPSYGEHADLSIYGKHGMYLRLKNQTLAFLADSNCLDRGLYRRITRELGQVDTLFIGMECDGAPMSWLYSPYFSTPIKRRDDESRRLSGSDSERAWAVTEEMRCAQVFVYAMGQEPWLQHLCGLQYEPDSKQIVESNKFIERCRHADIRAERLYGCREIAL
jgi:L-ascorbate metabolism protein UlaG (beta-lactamase superfamily)